ncbi:alpha-ketoglutarate-dependent 2,4-dichlorophenoxyacetate dioxygenase [Fusarium flagelliforme]|uniref:Alpha-ketoglutarate-dependent 2,4-dichlorophenoxyacetate dioxygenase n=1 Tax=Fusarium flagelliforme TaxID=2675880 RepID=A0A395N2X0_9HYPO|nr:alpha-ketoglutarate-dependent 2,4-dichlorophenoxyacetate dioxygenase [Fusarium flagelliforme]
MSSTQTVTQTKINELKPGFGVEIQGLDFSQGSTDNDRAFIEELVKIYGVVVIRKTKLDDASHISLARKFGELDDVKPYNKAGRVHHLASDELFDVGNIEHDGSIVDPSSPRAQANRGNSLFHVDSSFNPRRAGYSLLLSHELPPRGTGGSTEFCDTRAAWGDLDKATKQDLLSKDYIACHSIHHSKKMAAPEHFSNIEPADYPMGRHRLAQKHERSGRMNLYLAKHIHHIEGLSAEESQALFNKLFDHATQDKYRLEVEWQNVGDLVIWDNTCTMHRAVGGPFAYSDGVGVPKKPPCVSCHHSGSKCVLAVSRRGRHATSGVAVGSDHITIAQRGESLDAITVSPQTRDYPSDAEMQEYTADGPPEPLPMALRNPSDALQILAYSQDDKPVSARSLSTAYSDTTGRLPPHATSPAHSTTSVNGTTPSFILDDYELVQRGLIHPSILPELLHIYTKNYHPYCPIVPEYLLSSSGLERIEKSDHFLFTIILTIASRDSPNHVLVHRYCWDHTQHLLLQVLLAHAWSQTPRTVEGLILLSEWLPHIQANRATSEDHKSLSSEDRTTWSLVGLAVRLGYLLRLDTAAFRNFIDNESKEQEERKRLVWIFVYLLDRQISVRLGHSFWSRGPALSSHFTEKDFPSLKSTFGVNDPSYASVLEATLEVTQLIYNAHQILYPSTEKTLAMINNGDYPIYLDDFDRSITTWYAKWKDVQAPINVKTTLMLTYEYTRFVMLKRLWCPRDGDNSSQGQHNVEVPATIDQRDNEVTLDSSNTSHQLETQQGSGQDTHNSTFDRVEEYLLGSFWPGITEFGIDNELLPRIPIT